MKNSKIKNSKKKESHASPSQFGMGDFYGQAMKQNMGRIREDSLSYKPVKGTSKSKPKSLA